MKKKLRETIIVSVINRVLRANKLMRRPHTCFARVFLGLGHEPHVHSLMLGQLSTAGRGIGEDRLALSTSDHTWYHYDCCRRTTKVYAYKKMTMLPLLLCFVLLSPTVLAQLTRVGYKRGRQRRSLCPEEDRQPPDARDALASSGCFGRSSTRVAWSCRGFIFR